MPFLDYKLVEYAASIPSNVKTRPFKAKYSLKQAYLDYPQESLEDLVEMSYPTPVSV